MATPLAQAHYEEFFKVLGGKPVHSTLATHWARLIEALQATETIQALANDPGDPEPGRAQTARGAADGRHRHRRGARAAR